jgi:lipoprotein-anchoring transpeptidase ErfK/SrfK
MATSAYSEELNLFEGGLPIVALHGTNEPDTIGEKASNGCIRIDNDLITVLAEKMPPGVPLIVTEGVAVPVAAPSTAALPQAA